VTQPIPWSCSRTDAQVRDTWKAVISTTQISDSCSRLETRSRGSDGAGLRHAVDNAERVREIVRHYLLTCAGRHERELTQFKLDAVAEIYGVWRGSCRRGSSTGDRARGSAKRWLVKHLRNRSARTSLSRQGPQDPDRGFDSRRCLSGFVRVLRALVQGTLAPDYSFDNALCQPRIKRQLRSAQAS